jgi:hypothetical protein
MRWSFALLTLHWMIPLAHAGPAGDPVRPNPLRVLREYVPVLRDARAADDMTRWDFGRVQAQPGQAWVLADVVPAELSGAETVPGAYIDAKTGQLIMPPNPRHVMLVKGTVSVVAVLAGTPAEKTWSYTWDEPLKTVISNRSGMTLGMGYDPFRYSGGHVIALVAPAEKGRDQFKDVYLIPQDWHEAVIPAWNDYRENKALFQPGDAEKNRAALTALLEKKNPVVAAQACRLLARAGLLDPSFVQGPLARARGSLQTVMTLLILRSAPDEKQPAYADAFRKLIQSASGARDIQGAAVAAFAIRFETVNWKKSIWRTAEEILLAVKDRREALKVDADPAMKKYFFELLDYSALLAQDNPAGGQDEDEAPSKERKPSPPEGR